MKYEGPIYRPPSEAGSLLIQATVGCPHNKCTFCMVYKKGPRFRVRSVSEIKEDLLEARSLYGEDVRNVFFPAGNTIAMPTNALAEICRYTRKLFPHIRRITVYGSSQYVLEKGLRGLRNIEKAGLSRIHVGMETGDNETLRRIKKGSTREMQIQAGRMVREAGIELSEYVILGIGGRDRTREHSDATADALNQIRPDFVRLRTFVPKVHTLMLHQIRKGRFHMLSPHEVLGETRRLLERIEVPTHLYSDHYTNYVNITGRLPEDKEALIRRVDEALERDESDFRPFFIGTE